jgi:hypothetical protein
MLLHLAQVRPALVPNEPSLTNALPSPAHQTTWLVGRRLGYLIAAHCGESLIVRVLTVPIMPQASADKVIAGIHRKPRTLRVVFQAGATSSHACRVNGYRAVLGQPLMRFSW